MSSVYHGFLSADLKGQIMQRAFDTLTQVESQVCSLLE